MHEIDFEHVIYVHYCFEMTGEHLRKGNNNSDSTYVDSCGLLWTFQCGLFKIEILL